jgi:hypothetical protein
LTDMPIAATYKGVGIHAGQAARRIALVKREIDKIHNLRLDAVVRDRRRLCLELTPVPRQALAIPVAIRERRMRLRTRAGQQ